WTENANWLDDLQATIDKPSLKLQGPATVRAVVRDLPKKRIVHLLNLNVQRVSSFEDKVNPATNVQIQVRWPSPAIKSVKALSADADATLGLIPFKLTRDKKGAVVGVTIPRLVISTIVVIE
ncbi:MAG: glycoside hydrolase family 66 protein, partial [Verrucomicrobiota bacterium]